MEVVLTILRIIGILLLVLLALVLILLAILLLAPVLYRVQVIRQDEFSASGKVTWLLGVIKAEFTYQDQFSLKLLLFGKPLSRNPEKESPKKEESKEKPEKEEEQASGKTRLNIPKLLSFIRRPEVKRALHKAIRELLWIVKKILPKEPEGQVLFGLEDPADTGMLLGLVSAVYPDHSKLLVKTDFQQAVFNCNLSFHGKARIGTVVLALIRILLNKDIQYVIQNYRTVLKQPEGEALTLSRE